MGILEEKSARTTRRNKIKKVVLGTIAVAGLLPVAILAPNALQGFAKLGLIPSPKRQKEYIARARERLIKSGLIMKNEKGFLRLTPKGEIEMQKLELADFKLNKPKRWDEKWRILIFDIAEKRKNTREKVRRTLETIGFKRLQDSVWVYPYDCEDLMVLLKADFRIGKDLIYLIVEHMEYDRPLRKYFGLE